MQALHPNTQRDNTPKYLNVYPDSATSQFFINLKDNDFLNGTSTKDGYAVFGEVVSGMDVVRKIGRAPTGSKGFMDDVPVRPVIIESVKVLK